MGLQKHRAIHTYHPETYHTKFTQPDELFGVKSLSPKILNGILPEMLGESGVPSQKKPPPTISRAVVVEAWPLDTSCGPWSQLVSTPAFGHGAKRLYLVKDG